MKQLWVVEFNSMHYCGASQHCLVWAESEKEAMEIAEPYANEVYYEQDSDQYLEDYEDDEGECYGNVVGAELVVGSDIEKYVGDPSQSSFYPLINEK